jgi:two-component system NtrC family sensor kinase
MKIASIRRAFGIRAGPHPVPLGVQLLLGVTAVIVLTFATYAFVSLRATSRQWHETVFQGARRFSELIQQSTHYSMLLNRKEDVHHIIRTVAESPGVERVRIYDKNGVIIFSANESEIGRRVDLDAEACVTCHGPGVPLVSVPQDRTVRVFNSPRGERVLGLINPIENTPECYNAACHAHSPNLSVLGVLDVQMSMADPDAQLATARRQALTAAVLMAVLAGAFSVVFIDRLVRRPVRRLIAGTRRIASGELDTVIQLRGAGEMSQLAGAFNRMTSELRLARQELTAWSARLEEKLREKTEDLTRAQREVVHMEKMASLGNLSASIAHELNNPLAGIVIYSRLVARVLRQESSTPEERQQALRSLEVIEKEATRCGAIVRNLLLFSRRGGGEFKLHSLREVVEGAVAVVRHRLQMARITLELEMLPADDQLVCDGDQLKQALLAFFENAVDAMPNGGLLRVAVTREQDALHLEVRDTGTGIPEEALPHVFEPFFTTKPESEAEGAGLGLAVVYGIIQRHGGSIRVESEVNRGTTIHVVLPRRQGGPERSEPGSA